MQEVYDFLKKTGFYFLATVEGDAPKVRPFGTYMIYDGKLYIQTGKVKPVSKQMAANPKIEICAFDGSTGVWVRIAADAVNDDSEAAQEQLLSEYPNLKNRYAVNDGNMQVLYLKNATATFTSLTEGELKTVQF